MFKSLGKEEATNLSLNILGKFMNLKGLISWLSFVVSTVSLSLSHWYPGSGAALDCIDYGSDLSIDEMVGACFGCLSGPPGFTCWISFAPVFSFIYC